MLLGLLVAVAQAEQVVKISPVNGDSNPGDPYENVTDCPGFVKWSQPPEDPSQWFNGTASHDEYQTGDGPLDSETADDFPGTGPPITGARFWYVIDVPTEPDCPVFELTVRLGRNDGSCLPIEDDGVAVICQSEDTAKCVQIGTQFGRPAYEACAQFAEPCEQEVGGMNLWFTMQAIYDRDATGWGQCFWGANGIILNGCEVAFRGPVFGFPNWTPGNVVFGAVLDCMYELMFTDDTPVQETSWGTLKDLYR
jgi:hypothetical protein